MPVQPASPRPSRERAVTARPRPVEVAPGIHCLTLGRGVAASNVYLVAATDGWVLVDAGWARSGPAILAAAEEIFGARRPPDAILLTHVHPDHSGAAAELARHWHVPVLVGADELPFAGGGYQPEYAHPLDRWVVGPLLRLLPARTRARVEATGSLAGLAAGLTPGRPVPGLPGWDCIATPGHTPGHVAFHRPADGVVLTGDAVVTVDLNSWRGVLSAAPRVGGPPWYTTWHRPLAQQAIADLAALRPRVLAPGHGRVWSRGTAEALDALVLVPEVTRLRGSQGFFRAVRYAEPGRYRRPPRAYLSLQWLGPLLTTLNLSPRFAITLEVPGRRSGVVHRTTLVETDVEGERYLVALGGESEWVRNVRAAEGRAVLGRRRREAVVLTEVPVADRAPVLRAYVLRPGRAPRSRAVAREARDYFGVRPDLAPADLAAVAARYPVFRVRPARDRVRHEA